MTLLLLYSWDFYDYYDAGPGWAELDDIDPDELLLIWEANQQEGTIDIINVWRGIG